MAKLNTNSNAYTIGYASLMVIIVAFLLAFVASALKPTQDENVKLDTKKQILAALRITDCADVNAKYQEVFGTDELSTEQTFTANVDGEEKLVVVLKGAGLWGPIWGWVAIDKDGETVYGTFFNHEGETAGLLVGFACLLSNNTFKRDIVYTVLNLTIVTGLVIS